MTGPLAGRVAFVTGAARGQGRAHAIRLARDGADIVAVDICSQVASVPYEMATEDDLLQTADEVRSLGRRIHTFAADVRDREALQRGLTDGVEDLGRLDVVCANAGIFSVGATHELSPAAWREMIDINLSGVWHTAKVSIPHLIDSGGGAMILVSSTNGVLPAPMYAHYVAAKHGVVGLMKVLALELGPYGVRVNALLPSGVRTEMVLGFDGLTDLDAKYVGGELSVEDAPSLMDPADISNVVSFLASDDAIYVTGAVVPVTGGAIKAAVRTRDEGTAST
jgi:SDR family mycofactocin-dependent oxidoreductase